ncbi:MAG: hypothetical protein CMB48_02385 [Euryarchaeota archaeon]|nr:hypothetical protein [Euryarchaeota archaeon]|tara:strand:+ start:334 stop:591 length:258 start_codon:yes stop_codon:yes gene_type:complete
MDVKNKPIKEKDKLLLLVKFSNSEIYLPASLVPLSTIALILLVYITPYSLLISTPIILSFIGGIIMESISLTYEKEVLKENNEEE